MLPRVTLHLRVTLAVYVDGTPFESLRVTLVVYVAGTPFESLRVTLSQGDITFNTFPIKCEFFFLVKELSLNELKNSYIST